MVENLEHNIPSKTPYMHLWSVYCTLHFKNFRVIIIFNSTAVSERQISLDNAGAHKIMCSFGIIY
jgi:hypothetical protein